MGQVSGETPGDTPMEIDIGNDILLKELDEAHMKDLAQDELCKTKSTTDGINKLSRGA